MADRASERRRVVFVRWFLALAVQPKSPQIDGMFHADVTGGGS